MSDLMQKILELVRSSKDPLSTADISRRLGVVEDSRFVLTAGALGGLTRSRHLFIRFGKWYAFPEEEEAKHGPAARPGDRVS